MLFVSIRIALRMRFLDLRFGRHYLMLGLCSRGLRALAAGGASSRHLGVWCPMRGVRLTRGRRFCGRRNRAASANHARSREGTRPRGGGNRGMAAVCFLQTELGSCSLPGYAPSARPSVRRAALAQLLFLRGRNRGYPACAAVVADLVDGHIIDDRLVVRIVDVRGADVVYRGIVQNNDPRPSVRPQSLRRRIQIRS